MDLIDEQHFAGIQRTQDRSQVAGVLHSRAGGHANRDFKFIGHNHGQCGLTEAWRAGKQYVIRRHVTFAGCVEKQLELGLEPGLPDEPLKHMRAELFITDRLVAYRL